MEAKNFVLNQKNFKQLSNAFFNLFPFVNSIALSVNSQKYFHISFYRNSNVMFRNGSYFGASLITSIDITKNILVNENENFGPNKYFITRKNIYNNNNMQVCNINRCNYINNMFKYVTKKMGYSAFEIEPYNVCKLYKENITNDLFSNKKDVNAFELQNIFDFKRCGLSIPTPIRQRINDENKLNFKAEREISKIKFEF